MTAPLPRFRCVMLRRSGTTEIRIVRAESVEAARAICEAAGLNPVSIDPIGPSLFDSLGETLKRGERRLPRWRFALPAVIALPRNIWWPALLILATIPVSTALGSWALVGLTRWQADQLSQDSAPLLSAYARVAKIESARPRVEAVIAAPSLTSLVARLSAALPEGAGLASLTLDEQGLLTIEVETSDPDQLRVSFASDPLLGSLRNTGQSMTNGGTIRVILKGRIA